MKCLLSYSDSNVFEILPIDEALDKGVKKEARNTVNPTELGDSLY